MIESVLNSKDRSRYDTLSTNSLGLLTLLIPMIMNDNSNIGLMDREMARILELCACSTRGIEIMSQHLEQIVGIMEKLINIEGDEKLIELKYPAATVLLDITANE